MPSLWAIREHFAAARLTMLCDHHPRKSYVLAPDLLRGSGIVDDFMLYPSTTAAGESSCCRCG